MQKLLILLEYSHNYSMTSGNLWNHYKDDVNDSANENDSNDNMTNNSKTRTSKSFKYKAKIIERTPNNNSRLNTEVPLKNLSKFWRSFDLPLISCETDLDLRCSKYCIISEV